MEAEIRLVKKPWKDYKYRHPDNGWLGITLPETRGVYVRNYIAWVPIVGIRLIRHEVDHKWCGDFSSKRCHHDVGANPHECGRATDGFLTQFMSSHLRTSRQDAIKLRRQGSITVSYEEGSQLDALARQTQPER